MKPYPRVLDMLLIKDNSSGIYKILNKVNGNFYIGSSKNFNKRMHVHRSYLMNNKHANKIIQRAWDKYGEDAFEIIILSKCPPEYLIKLEQWFLDNLKPEYNIRPTADSNAGYKQTKEEIEKRKLSQKRTLFIKYGIDEERIISLLNEGKGQSEIAEILGWKNHNRVSKFIKRRGLFYKKENSANSKRAKKNREILDSKVIELSKNFMTTRKMAEILNTNEAAIYKSRKRLGLPIRTKITNS